MGGCFEVIVRSWRAPLLVLQRVCGDPTIKWDNIGNLSKLAIFCAPYNAKRALPNLGWWLGALGTTQHGQVTLNRCLAITICRKMQQQGFAHVFATAPWTVLLWHTLWPKLGCPGLPQYWVGLPNPQAHHPNHFWPPCARCTTHFN